MSRHAENVNPEDMLEMVLILLDNGITFSNGRYTAHSDLEGLVANPQRYQGDEFAMKGRKRHPLHLGQGFVTYNDTYGQFPWDTDHYWEEGDLIDPRSLAGKIVDLRDEAIEQYEWVDGVLEKIGEIPEWGNLLVEHSDYPGPSRFGPEGPPEIEEEADQQLKEGVERIRDGLEGKFLDQYLKNCIDGLQIPYLGFWTPKEERIDLQTSLWDYATGELSSFYGPPKDALGYEDLEDNWTKVVPEENVDRSRIEHVGQLLEGAGYSFDRDPREEDVNAFVTKFPMPPKEFWVKREV